MTAVERTHYLIVEGDKVVARCSAETGKERLAVEKEFARHPGAVLCLVLSKSGDGQGTAERNVMAPHLRRRGRRLAAIAANN